ncbi:MAG: hypothetical protein GY830_01955 [Bacteroidetes bacterium]|nr:hypothetical protein [Bacteroidota bacterium]
MRNKYINFLTLLVSISIIQYCGRRSADKTNKKNPPISKLNDAAKKNDFNSKTKTILDKIENLKTKNDTLQPKVNNNDSGLLFKKKCKKKPECDDNKCKKELECDDNKCKKESKCDDNKCVDDNKCKKNVKSAGNKYIDNKYKNEFKCPDYKCKDDNKCNTLELNRCKTEEQKDNCTKSKDCKPDMDDKCGPNRCIVKKCREIKSKKCMEEQFPISCKTKDLCDVDNNNLSTTNWIFNSNRALFTAKLLGATANDCSSDNFNNIYVSYTPYQSRLLVRMKGIINQAKSCLKKQCDICTFGIKAKDRIAVLSFGCDGKSVKWNNVVPGIVKSVCDYKLNQLNKCKYPKVKLEMIETLEYVKNPKDDERSYNTFTYDKKSLELMESMQGATKVYKDREVYERTIKSFIYACPIYCGCNYARSKFRDRDAFVFFGRNTCSDCELTFKEIHRLMKKGHADPACNSKRRMILMEKCTSRKKCKKVIAYVTFGWKLTIVYKNKEGKECFWIQRFTAEKDFF